MLEDGSNQVRLTNNAGGDYLPVLSPDGVHIAFYSARDGNNEIYSMYADGSGQTRLTSNTKDDVKPTWSPDGTRIAFWSNRDGNYEIYSMNADGSGQTRLTNNAANDYGPAWSPDGTRIAFHSVRDGNYEIYSMNADGSGQTRLTYNNHVDLTPAWSPDSNRIAFNSDRDGNYEIYSMNADGSGQTRITFNTAGDARPSWSPDGTRIAFHSDRDGNSEIYTMSVNGSGQTRLTDNVANDIAPNWGQQPGQQPDNPPQSQTVTNTEITQIDPFKWRIGFGLSGFQPNSQITASSSGTRTLSDGTTGPYSWSGLAVGTTDANGNMDFSVIHSEYGSYTYTFTDAGGNSASATISYSLPADIISVSPEVARQGEQTTITITGTNFSQPASASLGSNNLTDVQYADSDHITAKIPTSVPAGSYDLTINFSNGRVVDEQDALTVAKSNQPFIRDVYNVLYNNNNDHLGGLNLDDGELNLKEKMSFYQGVTNQYTILQVYDPGNDIRAENIIWTVPNPPTGWSVEPENDNGRFHDNGSNITFLLYYVSPSPYASEKEIDITWSILDRSFSNRPDLNPFTTHVNANLIYEKKIPLPERNMAAPIFRPVLDMDEYLGKYAFFNLDSHGNKREYQKYPKIMDITFEVPTNNGDNRVVFYANGPNDSIFPGDKMEVTPLDFTESGEISNAVPGATAGENGSWSTGNIYDMIGAITYPTLNGATSNLAASLTVSAVAGPLAPGSAAVATIGGAASGMVQGIIDLDQKPVESKTFFYEYQQAKPGKYSYRLDSSAHPAEVRYQIALFNYADDAGAVQTGPWKVTYYGGTPFMMLPFGSRIIADERTNPSKDLEVDYKGTKELLTASFMAESHWHINPFDANDKPWTYSDGTGFFYGLPIPSMAYTINPFTASSNQSSFVTAVNPTPDTETEYNVTLDPGKMLLAGATEFTEDVLKQYPTDSPKFVSGPAATYLITPVDKEAETLKALAKTGAQEAYKANVPVVDPTISESIATSLLAELYSQAIDNLFIKKHLSWYELADGNKDINRRQVLVTAYGPSNTDPNIFTVKYPNFEDRWRYPQFVITVSDSDIPKLIHEHSTQPQTSGNSEIDYLDLTNPTENLQVTNFWVGSDYKLTLVDPNGRVIDENTIDPGIAHVKGPTSEWFSISTPALGNWQIIQTAIDVPPEGEIATAVVLAAPNVPPVTSISFEGSTSGDWYVNDAVIKLEATDADSGVAHTTYSLDNGASWISYDGSFVLGQEGATKILAKSTDNAGNVEDPPASRTLFIDKTPPETSITAAGYTGKDNSFISDVSIEMSASDNLSGVAKTEYSLDNGISWQDYAGPISISQAGEMTILARSIDNAGNMETPVSKTVKICDVCGRPQLGLSLDRVYWASYPDYESRFLTVDYVVSNSGSVPAKDVEISDSEVANGVILETAMPMWVGIIDVDADSSFSINYTVPAGVGSFSTSVSALAKDTCNTVFSYP